MRHHKRVHLLLQVLRRLTQLFTISVLAVISFLSLYAHYYAAKATDDLEQMPGLQGAVLAFIDRQISSMQDPLQFLDRFKGTLWSMRFAGIDISDPLAAVELIATTRTLYVPFLISVIIPVAGTLLLGRVFCSFICPANLFFEVACKMRGALKYAEIHPASISFSLKHKYILLAAGLVVAAAVSQPLFALFYPPVLLSRIIHAWVMGTAAAAMLFFMLLLAAIELLVAPRWWCRVVCPGGALYALLGWPRLLRVKLRAARCTRCGSCEPVCDPGINPVLDSCGTECTNCGECIKACPENALYFAAGLPSLTRRSSAQRKLTSSVVLPLLLIVILLHAFPPSAHSHHILGLPHYSYKENFPQAPTLEYPATSGPYDILLTSYPGKPVPGQPATISFYVKNQETGEPYDKHITMRVLQTFTFGESKVIQSPVMSEPFMQPHKVPVTFPEDGEYVVELTMEVEGKPEIIPFIVTAGEPSSVTSVLITTGIFLVVFVVAVRAIKIKRARRLGNAAA